MFDTVDTMKANRPALCFFRRILSDHSRSKEGMESEYSRTPTGIHREQNHASAHGTYLNGRTVTENTSSMNGHQKKERAL